MMRTHLLAARTRNSVRSKQGHGPTKQQELPIETEVYELDDADLVCPCCGKTLEPLAGQYETSEMVDVIVVRYCVKHVRRTEVHV